MSFLSSWGAPPKPSASTPAAVYQNYSLSHSDENTPPPSPTDEKTLRVGTSILRSSNPLKTSNDNIPAAAVVPPRVQSISERWQTLKRVTELSHQGIDKVNSKHVDAQFPDVPCYKATQLPHAPMLHANKVILHECEVICSQAPTESRFSHFWKAVCESRAIILDLTNELPKPYYPLFDKKEQDGWLIVQPEPVKNLSNKEEVLFYSAKYHATHEGETHQVTRIGYASWNDMSSILVEDLDHLVRTIINIKAEQTLLVHCRAGVGRTGTFVVAMALFMMHLRGQLKSQVEKSGSAAVIDHLISTGRNQRGPLFVSNEVQYVLLHDYMEYLLKLPVP